MAAFASSSSSSSSCLFVCVLFSKDSQSGNSGVLVCNLMQWKKLLRGLTPVETGSRNLPVPLSQQYALKSSRLPKSKQQRQQQKSRLSVKKRNRNGRRYGKHADTTSSS